VITPKQNQIYNFIYIFFLVANILACNQNEIYNCDTFKIQIDSLKNNQSDTSKAIRILSNVIENNKDCIDALLTRADLYFELDSLDKSESDFNSVLRTDNKNIYALYQLGILSSLKEDFKTAISFFTEAISLKEKNGYIFNFNTKNTEVSANRYDIDYIELIYRLALANYNWKHYSEAYELYTICIEKKYYLSECLLYRGTISIGSANYKEACEDFKKSAFLGNELAAKYLSKYCK